MAVDRYYGLSPELANELRYYEREYFQTDKPVPFCGLTLYPVLVRDYEDFFSCLDCFTLDKSESVETAKMSHLGYLLSKVQAPGEEGLSWSFKLQKMLELIFRIENGLKCKDCGTIIKYNDPSFVNFVEEAKKGVKAKLFCPNEECKSENFIEMIKIITDPETKKQSLLVDGHEINSKDFIKLRQIVLYQNFSDYQDDSYVDKAVKQDYEAKKRMDMEKNDTHATLEKKVVCLSVTTNYTFEQIYEMPIRKFILALSTVDDLINYKVTKQGLMSGLVSLPKGEKLEHWIYKPDKDLYGDGYKSLDQVKSEVSNIS